MEIYNFLSEKYNVVLIRNRPVVRDASVKDGIVIDLFMLRNGRTYIKQLHDNGILFPEGSDEVGVYNIMEILAQHDDWDMVASSVRRNSHLF
jgi:hypothetical protein